MPQPHGAARSSSLAPFDALPFAASPLYSALCPVVAGNQALLDLAANVRAGQQPEFAFFGAVHYLLLHGAGHDLASFYPSVVGSAALAADQAGPALVSFCAAFHDELADIISSRLVQTNQVRRAVGLRTALAAIAPYTAEPVHLIEVGSSAGLLLRFDRYGYVVRQISADGNAVSERRYGDPASAVQLVTDLRGNKPLPDLDVLPAISSVTGVDLNPVDPRDADARAWLEALVWPEDDEQRQLLAAALDLVADDPPPAIAGDAIDVLPELARTLPPGEVRVVFHSATRMHVPQHRLIDFDAAIDTLGQTGPMWRIAVDSVPNPVPDPQPDRSPPGAALQVDAPDGTSHLIAVVNGHLRWVEPFDTSLTGVTHSQAPMRADDLDASGD